MFFALQRKRDAARARATLATEAERHEAAEALRASGERLQQLQSKLLHVSRLNTAGQMASALAHELSQPLTAIASALRGSRRMLQANSISATAVAGVPPVVLEAMDRATEQALRAGQIIRRLRDFVAKREADMRPENLGVLVQEASALALVDAQELRIQVTLRIDPSLPPVLEDRIQIQQVLVNLIRNARRRTAPRAEKGGEQPGAIGRSRGVRTTKIHALTDRDCRPIAFLLTGGHVADCTAGSVLLQEMPAARILHGDKGYDSNAIRRQVEEKGMMPNIRPKANRRWKNRFSPVLYRDRNAIERMFCRLKDFRRVATRYDRNAVNFLAPVCIAATVSYWL